MDSNSLFNNKNLKNIDSEKMIMLLEMFNKFKPSNTTEAMSFLINAKRKANESGMKFSSEETDMIIEVLKQSMSEGEKRKVDLIRNLMNK